MKDVISIVLTSLLAIGGLGVYMHSLSNVSNISNENNDKEIENEDELKPKNEKGKTKRNRKSYGTKRRFS